MKKFFFILLLIPFNVSASCKIAMASNGQILYKDNIHYTQSVASISKIMTSVVVLENSNINKKILIGDEINKAYGSGIYIKKGEMLKIKDLLYGLMLRSGNDAAMSLTKDIGYNKFIKLMNQKARDLGMYDSIFNNPSGLDEENGNYSSCYDMANLMRYAMKNKTFRKIVNTKYYKLKTNKNFYKWKNKNRLLFDYKYAIGGKTGFTKKAGRTLVTVSKKNDMEVIIVTIRDSNDFINHKRLYEKIFKKYNNYKILNKGQIKLIGLNTYYIKKDFNYFLLDNQKDLIKIKFKIPENKAIIYLENKIIGERKLYNIK